MKTRKAGVVRLMDVTILPVFLVIFFFLFANAFHPGGYSEKHSRSSSASVVSTIPIVDASFSQDPADDNDNDEVVSFNQLACSSGSLILIKPLSSYFTAFVSSYADAVSPRNGYFSQLRL